MILELSLNKTLGAGTYYLAISPYLQNQPDLGYSIKISNVEKVATNYPVSINEAEGNAINIGTLSVNNQINIIDYVGNVDQQDYYSFSLASENPVRLTINDVTNEQGINVSIYEKANPSPTLLNGSSSSSSSITLTSRKSLEAGKIYYLSVSPSFFSSNSKYTLNLKFE